MRQDAAACLGLLCTVLSYEAERIFRWLFLQLTSSGRDEVKLLYLVAVHRALEDAGERKAFSHIMQVNTEVIYGFYTVLETKSQTKLLKLAFSNHHPSTGTMTID